MIGALIYISTLRNRSSVRKQRTLRVRADGDAFSMAKHDTSSQEGISVSRTFSDAIDAEVYTADVTNRTFLRALGASLIVVSL